MIKYVASMKENKEKNMESMFHSTIGKMIVLAIDTFTKAKSNAYAFCACTWNGLRTWRRQNRLRRGHARRKRSRWKQPIVSRRLRIVSLFFDRTFGAWTAKCSSRCSEGFQSRIDCNGDVELRRCKEENPQVRRGVLRLGRQTRLRRRVSRRSRRRHVWRVWWK